MSNDMSGMGSTGVTRLRPCSLSSHAMLEQRMVRANQGAEVQDGCFLETSASLSLQKWRIDLYHH